MMITGNVRNMQTLTGHIGSTGIKGVITKQNNPSTVQGYVQNVPALKGYIKSANGFTGIIAKKSNESAKGDHQFIAVDLLKLHEQQIALNHANAIVPFTVQTSQQTLNKTMEIYAVPTAVSVSQVTANNITFTSSTVTVNRVTAIVDEEEYQNANE